MSQMIRYRNRDKRVSIKLGDPMTESHCLDTDKKSHRSQALVVHAYNSYSGGRDQEDYGSKLAQANSL
jgi:hypothetical protein